MIIYLVNFLNDPMGQTLISLKTIPNLLYCLYINVLVKFVSATLRNLGLISANVIFYNLKLINNFRL